MKGSVALRRPVATVRYDLAGGAITSAAYVTILAKLSNLVANSGLEIFNPTGSTLKVALGDVGSEVDMPYTILPGGTTGALAFEIPAGVRISMKAVDATGTGAVGIMVVNRFG